MNDNPIARNTDPETSHKAANKITGSGRRMTLTQRAAWLVAQYPNMTYNELYAKQAAFDYNDKPCGDFRYPGALMKRLNDARQKGFVVRGEARECSITGAECFTWHRTERHIRDPIRRAPKPKTYRLTLEQVDKIVDTAFSEGRVNADVLFGSTACNTLKSEIRKWVREGKL